MLEKSLAGNVALVTGSTTGLGLRIARQLAERGATVYVAGRSETAGRAAAAELPGGGFVRMDLSTIRSAHEAAQAFLALGVARLDILVNNAAVNMHDYHVNEDGLISHMAINYFGHFVLTNELLPLMEETSRLPGADVRIITVGAGAYKLANADRRFDSLDAMRAGLQGESTSEQTQRYAVSKLAQSLWARELARRLQERGSAVTSLVVNPGFMWSEGAQARMASFSAPVRCAFRALTHTPETSAGTVLWAVSAPAKDVSGRSVARAFVTGRIGTETWAGLLADGKWESLAQELWETSERVVKERLRGAV